VESFSNFDIGGIKLVESFSNFDIGGIKLVESTNNFDIDGKINWIEWLITFFLVIYSY
jgi:hypothetical protein